jgi:hypothetical protein
MCSKTPYQISKGRFKTHIWGQLLLVHSAIRVQVLQRLHVNLATL